MGPSPRENKKLCCVGGRYRRTVGQFRNAAGKIAPKKFLLGCDRAAAEIANRRLEKLWEAIVAHAYQPHSWEKQTLGVKLDMKLPEGWWNRWEDFPNPPLWTPLTLQLAEQIRRGEHTPVAIAPGPGLSGIASYVDRLAALQQAFPAFHFVPSDLQSFALSQQREVASRDLEDFAQVGLRWPQILEAGATFRMRLISNDAAMKIRMYRSERQTGLSGNVFSASSHVDDAATISSILDKIPHQGPNSVLMGGGNVLSQVLSANDSFELSDSAAKKFFNPTDGTDGFRLSQLLFEGWGEGQGTLVFEIVKDGNAISSASVDIRLRPMKELYDHYTVAYGTNVNSDGTFKNNIDPLDISHPVETAADLVGQNLERSRMQSQSSSYFVFVHGWRLAEYERVYFAESAYKRMYWSGYTGQFGLFSWPTEWIDAPVKDTGHFDRSEFVAWNSAAGLADALRDIRADHVPTGGELSGLTHERWARRKSSIQACLVRYGAHVANR